MSVEDRNDSINDSSLEQSFDDENYDDVQLYSGYIILLLNQSYLGGNSLDQVEDIEELGDLLTYINSEGLLIPVRLVHSVDPYQIQEIEETAKESPYPPLRSMNQYWILDARERYEEVEKIASILTEEFPVVGYAYPEVTVSAPQTNPTNEPGFTEQTYLQAAPGGIDAVWVWNEMDCIGEDVNLVDLEQNWNLDHSEFDHTNLDVLSDKSLFNDKSPKHEKHGTAVLGIVCAGANGEGGVGIIPGLETGWVLSHYRVNPETGLPKEGQVADAIYELLASLQNEEILPVDILLLEVEFGGRIAEKYPDRLDAIRAAVSKGIIVIEAAGNGGRDLVNDIIGDSGALVVGASKLKKVNGTFLHTRYLSSNYGDRVDCFAQGYGVATVGYNATSGPRFGGTSAAAAIIAGAAALLQSVHREIHGTSLTSDKMREWLKDETTGTLLSSGASKPIGVMPDLKAIIEKRLS